MSLSDQHGMDDFLALTRKVKTQQGADRFDQPIGSTIDVGTAPKQGDGQVTPTRLRSLQRQYKAALESGDRSLAEQVLREFQAAFQSYARQHSMAEAFLASNNLQKKK